MTREPSVTLERPITCVDDMETRKLSPQNSIHSEIGKRSKLPSQNSDLGFDVDAGVFQQTSQDPVFVSPPGIGRELHNHLHHHHPRMVAVGGGRLGGQETSDGGDLLQDSEGPATVVYDESADFTIHTSNNMTTPTSPDETQTLVKKPSTTLEVSVKNRSNVISELPPPPSPHHRMHTSSSSVRYPKVDYLTPGITSTNEPVESSVEKAPGLGGSSDEEVFDVKRVAVIHPQKHHQSSSVSEHIARPHSGSGHTLRMSQSEVLGRVSAQVLESPQTRTHPHTAVEYGYSNSNNNSLDHHQRLEDYAGQYHQNPATARNEPQTYGGTPVDFNGAYNPSQSVENRLRTSAQGAIPRTLNIDRNVVTNDMLHPKSYDNRMGGDNINLNMNRSREKIPSSSSVNKGISSTYLNNDPLMGPLNQHKPISPQNLNDTYLTVKLPPVENSEEGASDTSGDTRMCPICNSLFPVTGEGQQEAYERHVEECMRGIEGEHHTSDENEYRKCPMCGKKFEIAIVDQQAFENHVEKHFDGHDNTVDNFEVLNF